jgi:hypothetical protein
VFLRLATLTLAQALDLVTFWVMVRWVGPQAEANPVVADLFEALGLPGVIVAKVALVVMVGALAFAAATQMRARVPTRTWALVGGLPLALAIAVGLIGGITNTATLLG